MHHFTVDVEEYFQVSALERYVSRTSWDDFPSRVTRSVETLLELLAEYGARGTFFVLGWIARKHPHVVTAIADAGHEIASHGWGHERVTQLSRDAFRESVRSSRQELEARSRQRVLGYRAPSFSIVRGGEWALDILLEEGYTYDSSLFPVKRSGYGYVGGSRDPHPLQRAGGSLAEFPPTTIGVPPVLFPAGGGAYFRLLPYALIRSAFRACEARGVSGTFYIHPWELDPDQPRLPVNWRTRIRHYGGLKSTAGRLRHLVADFRFQSIATTLGERNALAKASIQGPSAAAGRMPR